MATNYAVRFYVLFFGGLSIMAYPRTYFSRTRRGITTIAREAIVAREATVAREAVVAPGPFQQLLLKGM